MNFIIELLINILDKEKKLQNCMITYVNFFKFYYELCYFIGDITILKLTMCYRLWLPFT